MGRGGLGVKGIFVLFVFEGVFFSWLGRKRGGGVGGLSFGSVRKERGRFLLVGYPVERLKGCVFGP